MLVAVPFSLGAAIYIGELVQVRKHIDMVFQRPNSLPLSIRDNVIFGYRFSLGGRKLSSDHRDAIVEDALQQVLLWDTVKDKLDRSASEECIFMLLGKVIEHAPTEDLFVTPANHETADYIEGRYG